MDAATVKGLYWAAAVEAGSADVLQELHSAHKGAQWLDRASLQLADIQVCEDDQVCGFRLVVMTHKWTHVLLIQAGSCNPCLLVPILDLSMPFPPAI